MMLDGTNPKLRRALSPLPLLFPKLPLLIADTTIQFYGPTIVTAIVLWLIYKIKGLIPLV
jgi:hypothetical protein